MAEIADVAAYICDKYPFKSELSKARLTKLVYLADWEFAQSNSKQLTNIRWYFHNFGPYVDDVINKAKDDTRFVVVQERNFYGQPKTSISLKDGVEPASGLSAEEKKAIRKVIDETKPLYWDSFIKHVYATKPILNANKHTYLDLVREAARVSAE